MAREDRVCRCKSSFVVNASAVPAGNCGTDTLKIMVIEAVVVIDGSNGGIGRVGQELLGGWGCEEEEGEGSTRAVEARVPWAKG